MPTHREQASRRFALRKNESTHWVKECWRKQNTQARPCAVVFSIPVGGILKVSGFTKNGTRSVPATILDPGQTVFSCCLICPCGRVRLVKKRHINKNIVNDAILFPVYYLSARTRPARKEPEWHSCLFVDTMYFRTHSQGF